MEILKFIVLAVVGFTVFFIGFAFLANLLICWIAQKSATRIQNKHLQKLEKMLPGKNCGQCGYPDCKAYGAAVFYESAATDKCTCGKEDLPEKMRREMDAFLQMLESDVTIDQLKKENKNR